MIKVINQVTIYEKNGVDVGLSSTATLEVRSHGLHSDRVDLVFDGEHRFTVIGADLQRAIANATNTGR